MLKATIRGKLRDFSKRFELHDFIVEFRDWLVPPATSSFDTAFSSLMETAAGIPGFAKKASEAGPRVGFAMIASGPWHLVVDVLLAHALRMRGAESEFLVCDLPQLPGCDERTIHTPDPSRCPGCIQNKLPILKRCGLSWQRASRFMLSHELDEAKRYVDGLKDDQLESCLYKNWPIGKWVGTSAAHFLRGDSHGISPEVVSARRRFLVTAVVTINIVERWLDRWRPDIVITLSGKHVQWRVAFELARARGIRVVCREMLGEDFHKQIFALNTSCESPDLNEEWERVKNTPLNPAQEEKVDQFLFGLPAYARQVRKNPELIEDKEAIFTRLRLDAQKKLIVLFTNTTFDLFVAQKDAAFDGMMDWIRETIRLVSSRPDVQLVIRAHPAESVKSLMVRGRVTDMIRSEFPELPDNVRLVNPDEPISSNTLRKMAGLNLVYCATVGLEAAIDRQPAFICGDPYYSRKGFTIDIDSRDAYEERINAWMAGEKVNLHPRASEWARRFLYLFRYRYGIPLGLTEDSEGGGFRVKVNNLSELLPGRHANVDLVCRGILEGRQILMPD